MERDVRFFILGAVLGGLGLGLFLGGIGVVAGIGIGAVVGAWYGQLTG